MASTFSSGKHAHGFCDVCGFRYPLKKLRPLVVKTKVVNILACPACWTPDQPQLQVGMHPVDDPQALRNPRRDTSYLQSGDNSNGFESDGSRVIQWGWNAVGGAPSSIGTPNYLESESWVGTVIVLTI